MKKLLPCLLFLFNSEVVSVIVLFYLLCVIGIPFLSWFMEASE